MFIKINYILEASKVQGPGTRFTIWVQGCSIRCQSCKNKDTWDFNSGESINIDTLATKIKKSSSTGLTITGGEPLDQFDAVYNLITKVSNDKDIFLCSGYTLKQINDDPYKRTILSCIDMICAGPFDETQICQSEWKGSRNQEIACFSKRANELRQKHKPLKTEYRINKHTGQVLVTGFTVPSSDVF